MEYTIYDGMLIALGVMILGCSFAIPALAFITEITGMLRARIFIDKFAQQTARLGLLFVYALGLAITAAWTASRYITDFYLPEITGFWIEYEIFWDFCLYLSILSILLFSTYFFLWNRMRRVKSLHAFTGVLAVIAVKILLALLIWAFYRELMVIPEVIPELDSIFLPILSQIYLLSLAAAAVLSLVYLLLRRNRDDFGRDYYRFALSFGAKWGILFSVFSPFACVWLYLIMDGKFDFSYTAISGAVYALTLIVMTLILWRVAVSDQPIRKKALLTLCPVLVWIIFVARMVSYLEFANMDAGKTIIYTFVRDWPVLF
ncbi:MAG: hypothetical protein D5R98_08760 [Desulfonatronovibrio sp. MSAO_Bac4]|nr:MAG: hypothetical protein D5R98_08760 [Desulfonatronovibrio sp. MSAO_Bac4]